LQPSRHHGFRQFALWLALAAVLLRALLPAGFMPERSAGERGIGLTICYASPLAKLRADQGQPSGVHDHASCAFSAAAGPGLPSSGIRSGQQPADAADIVTLDVARFASRFSKGRPPARAPPAFS
jgi:DUF2946 family protein